MHDRWAMIFLIFLNSSGVIILLYDGDNVLYVCYTSVNSDLQSEICEIVTNLERITSILLDGL